MQDLILQAIKQYDEYEAECVAAEEARKKGSELAAENEREQMRQFLATLMPTELVQYADLADYRLEQARYWRSDDNSGTLVRVLVPECFPVMLRVYHSDGELRHEKEKWSNSGPYFLVPTIARVEATEYGDDGYYIRYDGREHFEDFMTALGYAAVRGVELIPLQQEIEKLKVEDAVAKDDEPLGELMIGTLSPQERIANALETIASIADSMLSHKIEYGI